jgi:hypothetical protein
VIAVCLVTANTPTAPDYELSDRIALTTPAQVPAIGNPLRTTTLSLLHERAATETDLTEEAHGRFGEDPGAGWL